MNNNIIKLLAGIFSLAVMIIVGFKIYVWHEYSTILKSQNDSWINNTYKELQIKGIVSQIRNGSNNDFFTLEISENNSKISYGLCTTVNSPLRKFIGIGDSVKKSKGEIEITFIKPDGR